MEKEPSSILSSAERGMYQKFMEDPAHQGWTESDFKEFRDFALSDKRSSAAKNFFAVNGLVMEEADLPKAEEIKDLYN